MKSIEISNLSHQFDKSKTTLNGISLNVPKGSIYGFLGPNGAGKTTTLRLVLGLLQQQKGSIKITGKSFAENRIEILEKVGSLIEYPSIYEQLTAKQNLLIWQKIYQCSENRIEEVLTIVGLQETKNKKASDFSLGMKQRLGLATALLNNPEIIILDEPTNGLDPNGIIEIRELLLRLNKELGITILLSSHLLSEIEKLVTHVGLINQGKIVFEGELSALMNNNLCNLTLKTNDNEKAIFLLESAYQIKQMEDKIEVVISTEDEIPKIVKIVVENGLDIFEVSKPKANLENIFMNYINK
jgi:ABC-2 type transport system ATP-binding protein